MHFSQYNRLLSHEFVFHCPILSPQDTAGVHMVLYCTAKQAMLGNALNTCRGGRKTSKVTQQGFHFSLDAMFQQESHTHSPEQAQKLSCSQFMPPCALAVPLRAVSDLHRSCSKMCPGPPAAPQPSPGWPLCFRLLLNIEGKCIGTTENCFLPGLLVKCLIEVDKDLTDIFFPLRWIGKTQSLMLGNCRNKIMSWCFAFYKIKGKP